jgi:NAD(P)-dependent dehydrogenase (short-subunit alcohol dehydrogenase family)
MKVLVVGASGTLGRAVVAALQKEGHEVVEASRSGRHTVDITDTSSIDALYESVGSIDAVACAAGKTPFVALEDLTTEQFHSGINDKLMGQVELVRRGIPHVRDGGSFTVISGVVGPEPIRTGVVPSLVNGGLDYFVRAAAVEMPRGIRINAVSPTVLAESWDAYGATFPGFPPVAAAEVGGAYVRSVDGAQTGQTYRVGY